MSAAVLKQWIHANRAALLLFAISLVLYQPLLMPSLAEVNPWDETGYLEAGRLLLDEGSWANFASNPLTQLFFAAVILPFRSSPFWLVHALWLARPLLYALLWLGGYLAATALRRHFPPVIFAGLMLVNPLAAEMLTYPSDPLFAGLAALSLWQALRFHQTLQVHRAALASGFLALAALARNDGLMLFPLLVLWIVWAALPGRRWWRAALSAALPFVLIVGGYVLAYGASTGDFSLGTMQRAYDNFEVGQVSIAPPTDRPIREVAREVFGTPQENQYSILRAIQRSPAVYLQRVRAVLAALPENAARAYHLYLALPLAVAAGWGIITLLRRRDVKTLVLLVAWTIPLVSSLAITIFREGHLRFPYAVVFILAGTGLWNILARLSGRAGWTWIGLAVGLGAVAGLAGKPAFLWSGLVFGLGLVAARAALRWGEYPSGSPADLPEGLTDEDRLVPEGPLSTHPSRLADGPNLGNQSLTAKLLLCMLALLCAGLVLHGGFSAPRVPALGRAGDEQALLYLAQNYPPGTPVLTGAPGTVTAAGMQPGTLVSGDVPNFKRFDDFSSWAQDQGFVLLYIDHNFPGQFLSLVEPEIGSRIERIFQAGEGDYQLLRFAD